MTEPDSVGWAPSLDAALVPEATAPNLLVLIADDVGVDVLAPWGIEGPHPDTPVIDGLAASGVRFDRAYANPTCTPTRFAALTGRYARRRGVGRPIFRDEDYETSPDERSLGHVLRQAGYSTFALGKWHLSSDGSASSYDHPELYGFEHHGFLQRLDYWDGLRNDAGTVSVDPVYQTTSLVDDALHYANTTPGPWLIWAGFLAAHRPLHVPPDSLNPRGLDERSSDLEVYHGMVEAMDLELGRLLDGLDPRVRERTIIVFLGDNGTITELLPSGWSPTLGKGSVYEAGTRVPMLVTGPGVAEGASTDSPVHAVDLFPTLLDLAGVDSTVHRLTTATAWDRAVETGEPVWMDEAVDQDAVIGDGVSFAGLLARPGDMGKRRYVYTERFWPKGPPPYHHDRRGLRDERFKLIVEDGKPELYDLYGRQDDGPDLLERGTLEDDAAVAFERLTAVLDAHERHLVFEP